MSKSPGLLDAPTRKALEDEALVLQVEALRLEVLERKLLWSNRDMQLALGIGETSWLDLKRRGEAPDCTVIGGVELWSPKVVEAWIAELPLRQPRLASNGNGNEDNDEVPDEARPSARSHTVAHVHASTVHRI